MKSRGGPLLGASGVAIVTLVTALGDELDAGEAGLGAGVYDGADGAVGKSAVSADLDGGAFAARERGGEDADELVGRGFAAVDGDADGLIGVGAEDGDGDGLGGVGGLADGGAGELHAALAVGGELADDEVEDDEDHDHVDQRGDVELSRGGVVVMEGADAHWFEVGRVSGGLRPERVWGRRLC